MVRLPSVGRPAKLPFAVRSGSTLCFDGVPRDTAIGQKGRRSVNSPVSNRQFQVVADDSGRPLAMDKRRFFRWAEGREGRFELKDNVVMMMVGGTRLHSRIIFSIAVALNSRLDGAVWAVTTNDMAVEIGEDIRYPDVLVEPTGGDPKALSTNSPLLLVEVLSSSSLATDMNVKAAEYMSLASLQAYIVAAQDEPRLWIWVRQGAGWPAQPAEYVGKDGVVRIDALGIDLPMAEIFAALND
jgi:Uma2 family endonuclease